MAKTTRTELKYILHLGDKPRLLESWGRYLLPDPHTGPGGVYPVLSLYYDSPNWDFYRDKIEGFGVRLKARLRTYGFDFSGATPAFLEIKRREMNTIGKERLALVPPVEPYLDPERWPSDASGAEFGYLRETYRLRPAVQVFYFREAYRGAVEADMRVTVDTYVHALLPGEQPRREMLRDESRRIVAENFSVLEVKSTAPIPPWARRGLNALELAHCTFSKYANAVDRLGLSSMQLTGGLV